MLSKLAHKQRAHEYKQQTFTRASLWNEKHVQQWLRAIRFTEYAHNFAQQRVNGEVLLTLTAIELAEELGMNGHTLHIRRMMTEIRKLKHPQQRQLALYIRAYNNAKQQHHQHTPQLQFVVQLLINKNAVLSDEKESCKCFWCTVTLCVCACVYHVCVCVHMWCILVCVWFFDCVLSLSSVFN